MREKLLHCWWHSWALALEPTWVIAKGPCQFSRSALGEFGCVSPTTREAGFWLAPWMAGPKWHPRGSSCLWDKGDKGHLVSSCQARTAVPPSSSWERQPQMRFQGTRCWQLRRPLRRGLLVNWSLEEETQTHCGSWWMGSCSPKIEENFFFWETHSQRYWGRMEST